MSLPKSELILNDDGSIYHLGLLPHQIANTVITVGDPERVSEISKHFDDIEYKVQRREFCTHTGKFQNKRLTVISTGIGTDNIDIVLNELDTLVNVDLENREIQSKHKSLDIIRIGTSGAVQEDIPVDTFLISGDAFGFDSLKHWYAHEERDIAFAKAFQEHIQLPIGVGQPYYASASPELVQHFRQSHQYTIGTTITNVGFYAPQGRSIRVKPAITDLNQSIANFKHSDKRITNLEMETAGIYSLASLLGHRAISLNAILANRATGKFSTDPAKTMDQLIKLALGQIVGLTE